MKRTGLTVAAILGLMQLALAVGFVVTPPRFELMMGPGQAQTYTVSVVNLDSISPLKLQASTLDWSMKNGGQLGYAKPGSVARSCTDWIGVNPAEFEIPRLAEQVVRFTVKVPDSSFGSYWSVLFFESQPDTAEHAMVGVRTKARVGIWIYVTVPGTEVKQVDLVGFAYKRKGPENHEFKLQIKNTGNAYLRPKGKLDIKDAQGVAVASVDVSDEIVLPGLQRDLILPLNRDLAPGRYTAVINLDCGTPELLQGETAFEVVK